MAEFFKLLATAPDRVTYGANHVMGALMQGAVKTLILTQVLFRHPQPDVRAKYLEMRKLAHNKGGSVIIMSDMHPSGERLISPHSDPSLLLSLYVSISVSLSLYLSISISIYLSIYLYLYLSLSFTHQKLNILGVWLPFCDMEFPMTGHLLKMTLN